MRASAGSCEGVAVDSCTGGMREKTEPWWWRWWRGARPRAGLRGGGNGVHLLRSSSRAEGLPTQGREDKLALRGAARVGPARAGNQRLRGSSCCSAAMVETALDEALMKGQGGSTAGKRLTAEARRCSCGAIRGDGGEDGLDGALCRALGSRTTAWFGSGSGSDEGRCRGQRQGLRRRRRRERRKQRCRSCCLRHAVDPPRTAVFLPVKGVALCWLGGGCEQRAVRQKSNDVEGGDDDHGRAAWSAPECSLYLDQAYTSIVEYVLPAISPRIGEHQSWISSFGYIH